MQRIWWHAVGLIFLTGVLAGCGVVPVPVQATAWENVITLGTAEQLTAPAITTQAERVTVAWVEAGEGALQTPFRAIRDGLITPPVTLPLAPRFLRDLRAFPGVERSTHLLWLDIDDDGTPQVFNALADETLNLFRGPVQVSDEGARCYDTFPNGDGVWVVWSGGPLAAPMLYSASIDPTGRPLRVQPIAQVNGCPVTVETLTQQFVLLAEDDGTLHLTPFLRGQISAAVLLVQGPLLETGDLLRGVRAGSDGEHLYAFWNITRGNGSDEIWWSSAVPGAATWPPPRQLSMQPDESQTFDTSFNTGQTHTATSADDGLGLAWAGPLRSVTGVLPVAVEAADGALGVVYFDDGAVVGYQRVVPTRGLLAPPELLTDRDRHLYLAWSEVTDIGEAQLQLVSTRPLLNP